MCNSLFSYVLCGNQFPGHQILLEVLHTPKVKSREIAFWLYRLS